MPARHCVADTLLGPNKKKETMDLLKRNTESFTQHVTQSR